MTSGETSELVRFMFELGQLKRVKRSGWWLIGIKDPESVAEHSFRAGLVGYILAKMEGVDADKVMKMCLIQDLCEARLNDLHKLGHRYIDFRGYERQALKEQLERLPDSIRDEFLVLFDEYATDSSREGIVARDADLLECALQAREYADSGYIEALGWHTAVEPLFKTSGANLLFKELRSSDSNSWWKGLKKTGR